jgi:protein-L-isoaspartate(D-aspartate) O-methyltransferase
VNTVAVVRASRACLYAALGVLLICALPPAARSADPVAERLDMVRTIVEHPPYRDVFGSESPLPQVIEAMQTVERHLFVPEDARSVAYADSPVAIGFGQTISQPFIVALMTHLLAPEPNDVVLEIGTGSGYQAAVLSPLVGKVCTVEIITALGEAAAVRLSELGYDNVDVKVADGYHGWPECGPFDGIVVTAAADHVPPPLVDQLKPGGHMVIPVGGRFAVQYLTLVEKTAAGELVTRQLLPVRFVPFTRGVR